MSSGSSSSIIGNDSNLNHITNDIIDVPFSTLKVTSVSKKYADYYVIFYDCIKIKVTPYDSKPGDHSLFESEHIYNYSKLNQKQKEAVAYEYERATVIWNKFPNSRTGNQIKRIKLPQELLNDIRDYTIFTRSGWDWHCLRLLQKYHITSEQLFISLATSDPFGSGIYSHNKEKMKDLGKEFQKMAADNIQRGYDQVYLDYWNGIGFKLSIPTNITTYKKADLYNIDYRRYDDRNSGSIIAKIIQLIHQSYELNQKNLNKENKKESYNINRGAIMIILISIIIVIISIIGFYL